MELFSILRLPRRLGISRGRSCSIATSAGKHGLKEKTLLPPLERNCTADCSNNYLLNNSDWVNAETVISTAPDQIAIAPGSLVQEWTENGHRFFRYKLDHFGLNFYSFLSARYTVKREKWNDVNIEVYYLKEHPWNVPKCCGSCESRWSTTRRTSGPTRRKKHESSSFRAWLTLRKGFRAR